MPTIQDKNVKNFESGLVTRVEQESIKRGAASDAENWLTLGDHIELRRGTKLMGSEVEGTGKITGLKRGSLFDGTEVLFRSRGRKVEYFDENTSDWVEAGSDVLPADASGEEVSMDTYHSLAGAFLYLSSPNSSIYKIPIANPGSIVDQNSTSHRGYFKIKQGRMMLWNRKDANGGFDKTGFYLSYIDKDELSDFTETTNESVGTGDGSTTNFTGTLANVTGVKTCMYVRITDTVETFTDDRNGTLIGNNGGTGTINYATGAFDITFGSPPSNSQDITADYYVEDATSEGIADFSKSTPRSAGEGAVFRQDDGGAEFQNVGSIGDSEYCMHNEKTWKLTISEDDTNATNLIYRSRVGIPNWRAMEETGRGILYTDIIDQNEGFIRLLELSTFSTEVIPQSLSSQLDLSDYRFDTAVVKEWGTYDIVVCRHKDSTVNDTMFVRHQVWDVWDKLTYRVGTVEEYKGALVGGDSTSNNVFELFSGFDDEGAVIPNHYTTDEDRLDTEGVKVVNRFMIGGLIARDQKIKVSFSTDRGSFVEKGNSVDDDDNHVYAIEGDASYVDQGQAIGIGSNTIGGSEIGGGSGGDTVTASPYRREFVIATDRFEFIQARFEAVGIGYVSISEYGYRDIRYKGRSLPQEYVSN